MKIPLHLTRWNGSRTWKPDGKATAYRKVNMQKRQESAEVITVYAADWKKTGNKKAAGASGNGSGDI